MEIKIWIIIGVVSLLLIIAVILFIFSCWAVEADNNRGLMWKMLKQHEEEESIKDKK